MSRKIVISKYQGNTHYSVHVYDSFNQEHHIGYSSVLSESFNKEIHKRAEEIWSKEVKKVPSLMSMAIKQCVEIDIKNGMTPSLD